MAEINEKPLLMRDSTEGDGKAETVMDYVLSWSLRQTVVKNEEKPILHQYCRYMLYKLLQIEDPLEHIIFEEVKVWKQWKYIDLCVEVTLSNNGVLENYALLIEDKYYSPLRYYKDSNGVWHNQLECYINCFNKYYTSIKSPKWKLKYALVSCFEREDAQIHIYDKVEDFEVKVFGFYDIIDNGFLNIDTQQYIDSESEIFNEFWLRKW